MPASYSMLQIADIIQAKIVKKDHNITLNESQIFQICIDSRQENISPHTIFFALRGTQHDAHQFLAQAYAQGIRVFVVEYLPPQSEQLSNSIFLQVNNSLRALQQLAAFHRRQFLLQVIAITGSNGKTIVKEWLRNALSPLFAVVASPKSYNSQVGVPLSVWEINAPHQIGIFEAGISTTHEMQHLAEILRPNIGILTNIGTAHNEGFSSQQEKIEEKLQLFEDVNTLIFRADSPEITNAIRQKFAPQQCFSWSTQADTASQVLLQKIEILSAQKSRLQLQYLQKNYYCEIPFSDEAAIENAMHVICTLLYLQIDWLYIAQYCQQLAPVAMRLETKAGINFSTLLNDSYNTDLLSLKIALNHLAQQQQHAKHSLILSDIPQTGETAAILYKKVAQLLDNSSVKRFIGIGEELFAHQHLFDFVAEKIFFKTTEQFLQATPHFFQEAILIKGARQFTFEKIATQLSQQTHSAQVLVNLNALAHNYLIFKRLLKPNTKIMAMVKATSYGLGIYEIAQVLQHYQADYLAVAYTDEGISLRQSGIRLPIMVMNADESSFGKLLEYSLEPEIFSVAHLQKWLAFLHTQNINAPYSIHLKVDSGMHRLGFVANDLPSLQKILSASQDKIQLKSVFTHLAASDELAHSAFTLQQIDTYQNFCEAIQKFISYPFLQHALNTAGIVNFKDYQMDMVRLGIGLYGVNTGAQNLSLEVCISLQAVIVQIKNVAAGESIGYGRNTMLEEKKRIATLNIGYSDGLPRIAGNGNVYFWLNGKKVPTIGNICMDMCMIDVSNVPCSEGDVVEIFGENAPIESLAEACGTIAYEILTGISQRLQRVYRQE
ncbi:MAG: bifunctional UDP-N-acetylmuramoyl-tripeptide:D-alanyl-D-alanine ligase/alanine racemase [Chitinophagales bacterium]|nr:bifunctional UDP-N-acetylmuramoyl-tripeptide:D-alanyl-D-alanine ligase/alanine racemase [Bacteroidota bacterium]MCB9044307.1 bifunctional UDP-N-acetylmuramoyl-tripeptide:D-alanyl-D-alanine ligase/alanine racemase [Chitinophagales bacterium]